jgi:uncharacterized protein YdeI (YjbR/CyaY-like superfamily)
MHKGIVCIIAAFKQHCAVNFWRRGLIVGTRSRRATDDKEMAKLERMTSVADMPSKAAITGYVKLAIKLNDGGVKSPAPAPRTVAKKKSPVRTPPSLSKALARNARAKATYDGFSPSHKREYIEWITEAKSDETRDRRIEQALGWMAEGKSRNWKYIKK